jgi:hypothetical protein
VPVLTSITRPFVEMLVWIARHSVEILAVWVGLMVFAMIAICVGIRTARRRDEYEVCVCGHPKTVHEHFRDGDDCGRCGKEKCPRYRRAPIKRGAAVRIDGDEHGRRITYQTDGARGPAEPDVTSCQVRDDLR